MRSSRPVPSSYFLWVWFGQSSYYKSRWSSPLIHIPTKLCKMIVVCSCFIVRWELNSVNRCFQSSIVGVWLLLHAARRTSVKVSNWFTGKFIIEILFSCYFHIFKLNLYKIFAIMYLSYMELELFSFTSHRAYQYRYVYTLSLVVAVNTIRCRVCF